MARLIIFFVLCLLVPRIVMGSDCDLQAVTGFCKVRGRVVVDSVFVPKGATLELSPGTQLFVAGGEFKIEGSLIAKGTSANPIFIGAWNIAKPISFSLLGEYVELTNGEIRGAQGSVPVVSASYFDEVSFFSPGILELSIHKTSDRINWGRINLLAQEGAPAISASEYFISVHFDRLTFRSPDAWTDGVRPRILFAQGVSQFGTSTLSSWSSSCPISLLGDRVAGGGLLLTPRLLHCPLSAKPSVLFIPGYGTSIDVASLEQHQEPFVPSTNWEILWPAAPSYWKLVTALASAGVRVHVAPYDWRLLPADAASQYVVPIITKIREHYPEEPLTIIAHSYGGLVAKALSESGSAQAIARVITLGTPYAGAPKAEGVWNGEGMPAGWEVLEHLVRFHERYGSSATRTEAIRRAFPSLQALQPPVYTCGNSPKLSLQVSIPWTVIVSKEQETITELCDGMAHYGAGDGTVPLWSAAPSGVQVEYVDGYHAQLPAVALPVLGRLLGVSLSSTSTIPWKSVAQWLVVDCPVQLGATGPTGSLRADSGASPFIHEATELHMMIMDTADWRPITEFQIRVRATANGRARAWWNEGSPVEFELEVGKIYDVSLYALAATSQVLPSAALVIPVTSGVSNSDIPISRPLVRYSEFEIQFPPRPHVLNHPIHWLQLLIKSYTIHRSRTVP